MKNIFSDISRPKLINSSLIIIFSLFGFAVQDFKYKDISPFERLCIEMVAPLQSGVSNVQLSVRDFIDNYFNIVETNKKNKKLNKEISKLNARLFMFEEIKQENERLKKLLEFGADIELKKVLAQVVGWDASNEFKVLRINKGEKHGIKNLSAVITMDGLVGYIQKVYPNYSDVLTILDANNRVDSIVESTRSHGIIEGNFGFSLSLKYIHRIEAINKNDIVISAGLGNIYPKGIRVGTVDKVEKESFSLVQKIDVLPSVDFRKLEEVVVLIKNELE